MDYARKPTDIFLQPGEYFVGDAAHRICTVLGSCVSIMLWHPARRIGALSHFLLASRGTEPGAQLDARYGEEAMSLMLRELGQLKISATECQGKIFGGANMFPKQVKAGLPNVGKRNGETARSLLQSHGIPLVSESLFGIGHRKIIFDISTGNVWARQEKLLDAQAPELKEAA